ncbi:hypothetical protein KKC67_01980 [Patescibacteria group bacterium]|nr:hypothetical protein [Patescibacteria group bacterium]MBU0879189.1 hypothetical protein [Patescibacteria group bacterium]MBU0880085.1 hypothetical protein [Patescibacteria group bacterium]MBU0897664.1 hypothetical protein [Patescibacteria group bacterium]MBU1062961.1 hypothetical protein [Patescibacteria group bacterium]
MGNFNRGGGGGFGGNRGGGNRFSGGGDSERSGFRRDDRAPAVMTQVVCDECKKPCEVPFRPTAGKPVYCNDCFRKQGDSGRDRIPRRDFNDRPQFPKPSFGNNEVGNDVKKQLELLNFKLDKLILSIENLAQVKSFKEEEVEKNITVVLPKKEEKKEIKKKETKKDVKKVVKKEIKKKVGKK